MPKLDLANVPVKTGSIYPEPYASMMRGRSSLRLGEAGGLTQFGANLVILQPGALSSLRHWHLNEDEFVMVTEGECTLVQDEGEVVMRPGDCAAFPAGSTNGHHLRNRTDRVAKFLVVGTKAAQETATYSDVDMVVHMTPGLGGKAEFTHKDGTPWTGPREVGG
ncbi:MAG: cupin domain-containing protein [Pseudomonadota bacterium]